MVNAALQQPEVQRWLGGGDVQGRLWLRLALHQGIVTIPPDALDARELLRRADIAM